LPLSCYDKAAQLLATRPHFRRELETKLQQRGYPADEIAATLERLTEQRYLDDRAAARSFVESRSGRGEGRARLRAELLRRGAAEEVAEEALAELTPEELSGVVGAAVTNGICTGISAVHTCVDCLTRFCKDGA
jgi:regulatory protein